MKNKLSRFFIWSILLVLLIPFQPLQARKFPISKKHKAFLSKVQYIITKDEAKFFRHLPESKRQEFIRMFWEIRDPHPETDENEFKEDYLKRFEDANRMFSSAREGWLTDRGKTYILLGPPRHISDYPTGSFYNGNTYRRPFVVFHYEEIYLLFLENKNDGDYQVQYTSMFHHSEVQKAFAKAKRQIQGLEGLFQYRFKYQKIGNKPHLVFSVELTELNFKKQDKRMVSQLEIAVIVKDQQYNEIFKHTKTHDISLDSETVTTIPKRAAINFPIDVPKGKYFVYTSIKRMDDKNRTFYNKLLKIK